MNDIFISYKVHDRSKAIEYYRVLKTKGYSLWFDQFVPKGADWKKTIYEEIGNSKMILCLLSQSCLLDDWVLYQLSAARFLSKKIIFVFLDDTDWNQYSDYQVEKGYLDLETILKLELFSEEKEAVLVEEEQPAIPSVEEPEILEKNPLDKEVSPFIKRKLFLPIFNFSFLLIVMILTFIFGIKFLRISLDRYYGFIYLGMILLVILSYFHKRILFLIQAGLSVALLCVTIYVFPSYYASGIVVNGFFFLIPYLISSFLCHTKAKPWAAILLAIGVAFLFIAFDAAVLIFFSSIVSFDMPWFSIVVLVGYLSYLYWSMRNDFR